MKTNRIIIDLLNEEPIATEFIPSGLTNKNTKVTLSDKTVVLREPKEANKHLFNYPLEADILKHVRHLDTPLIYFNESTGIKISEFIPKAETFKKIYTENAAKLIKRLHALNYKSGVTYDILKTFQSYKTTKPLHDLSPYTHFLHEAKKASGPFVLCHNDLVEGNFLFTKNKDYLIDYEYACDNDIFFDLMSFITENDIQDASQRAVFYKTYFERMPNQDELRKLDLFERALHVLWCQWACMMYESHGDTVYKEIADLKYKRLIELQ